MCFRAAFIQLQRRIVVGESGEGKTLESSGSWMKTTGERRLKVDSGFGF